MVSGLSLVLLFLLILLLHYPTATSLSSTSLSPPPISHVHIVASSKAFSPFGITSPVSSPTFLEAAQQVKIKVQNCDPRIKVSVSSDSDSFPSSPPCDLLLTLGVPPPASLPPPSPNKGRFVISPPSPLPSSKDFVDSYAPDAAITLPSAPWSSLSTARRLHDYLLKLFSRYTTDDYATGVLLFVNQYSGEKVPWVQHSIDPSWEKGAVQNAREVS
jgi:hypothetical protein